MTVQNIYCTQNKLYSKINFLTDHVCMKKKKSWTDWYFRESQSQNIMFSSQQICPPLPFYDLEKSHFYNFLHKLLENLWHGFWFLLCLFMPFLVHACFRSMPVSGSCQIQFISFKVYNVSRYMAFSVHFDYPVLFVSNLFQFLIMM